MATTMGVPLRAKRPPDAPGLLKGDFYFLLSSCAVLGADATACHAVAHQAAEHSHHYGVPLRAAERLPGAPGLLKGAGGMGGDQTARHPPSPLEKGDFYFPLPEHFFYPGAGQERRLYLYG